MKFKAAEEYILARLHKELDPKLTYHSVSHTLDVLESALRLGEMEGINEEEMCVLKTACLFHDVGMLKTYRGHEEASVEICKETLPGFGYSSEQIEEITRMILSTKLPQIAMSRLEKILCDADLDYLGRPDYFMIAHRLKYEWEVLGIGKISLYDWYKIQKDFLTKHRYFTPSAIKLREKGKLENLKQVELILNHEK